MIHLAVAHDGEDITYRVDLYRLTDDEVAKTFLATLG